MSANEPEFLAAFGEPTFFRTAFTYSLDQVKQWMQDCCDGKKGGNATLDSKTRELLKTIYTRILSLIIPAGPDFLEPAPKSHFLRKLDSDWLPTAPTATVRFALRRWSDLRPADWWNPYDLLGLFLSTLGPAPPGADKTNYFVPLTAVYGQWCSRIGGPDAPPGKIGVGFLPAVFQATWNKERPSGSTLDDSIDFFLGSSVAGDGWEEKQVGQWKARVQRARFDMFYSGLRLKLFKPTDFDSKLSPQQQKHPERGQPFGNCAETYPFISNVSLLTAKNKALSGLAIKSAFINKGTSPVYNHNKITKALMGPCLNCQQLITYAGASQANFDVMKGQSSSPKSAQETMEPTAAAKKEEVEGAPDGETTTTTQQQQQSAVTNPPDGWTVDPDELDTAYYWGDGGDGKAAAARVGLANPTGQMVVGRQNGGDAYMFTTPDGKVYLWNMISHEIYEYTKPTSLADIVAQMRMPQGKGSWEKKLLHDA